MTAKAINDTDKCLIFSHAWLYYKNGIEIKTIASFDPCFFSNKSFSDSRVYLINTNISVMIIRPHGKEHWTIVSKIWPIQYNLCIYFIKKCDVVMWWLIGEAVETIEHVSRTLFLTIRSSRTIKWCIVWISQFDWLSIFVNWMSRILINQWCIGLSDELSDIGHLYLHLPDCSFVKDMAFYLAEFWYFEIGSWNLMVTINIIYDKALLCNRTNVTQLWHSRGISLQADLIINDSISRGLS